MTSAKTANDIFLISFISKVRLSQPGALTGGSPALSPTFDGIV
jgi:hypothetical protein